MKQKHVYNYNLIMLLIKRPGTNCPPLSRKRGDIKSHSSSRKRGDIKSHSSVSQSVRLSVSPSVTKTLTLAITFALLQVELLYLACVFIVTLPFWWYHVVTLTVTFDLLQGQICCRAGDHNSLNLLVIIFFLLPIRSRLAVKEADQSDYSFTM